MGGFAGIGKRRRQSVSGGTSGDSAVGTGNASTLSRLAARRSANHRTSSAV